MRSFFAVDWRDAFRALRAAPVVTLMAVLSLALGIGANTALFSILNSLLLKSLPVQEPQRLVLLENGSWTNPIWEAIRGHEDLFDGAFAWSTARFDLAERGETETAAGAYASGRAFDVLGVRPFMGRLLTAGDDVRGGGPDGPVAVISHRFWRQRFNGAADVVGKHLPIQRVPFRIVGVMPAGFFGIDVGRVVDVVIPLGAEPLMRKTALDNRSTWWLEITARLKSGQTIDEATGALRGVQAQVRQVTLPGDWSQADQDTYLKEPLTWISMTTGRSPLRTRYQQPLTIIMVVVAAVLLIACANIANLLIARATARRHELSLRMALGASRWRLFKQLLVESLMLAAAGAAAGLVFAHWGSRLLVGQLATATSAPFLDLSIDWRVLAFTGGVAGLTALLSGIAPALGVTRVQPNDALKQRGRGPAFEPRFGIRQALVVLQVALSLALVVGAALFARTFVSLSNRPAGFDIAPILVLEVDTRKSAAQPGQRLQLFAQLRDAIAAVPGVANAAVSFTTPLGSSGWNTRIEPPQGLTVAPNRRLSWVNAVTPEWFATYGITRVSGRGIEPADRSGAPLVAVINQAFASRFFPDQNPVGQSIKEGGGPQPQTFTIVGVVEDTVYRSLRDEPAPTMYRSLAQLDEMWPDMALSVRAAGNIAPLQLSRAVVEALGRTDPESAVTVRALSDQVGATLTQERLVALLSGFFGGLALLLAGLGLYGVTSYAVNRRRGEIGIRMALGAGPSGIVRLVVGRVGWLVAAGVAAGGVLSVWASSFVAALLYGVQPRDLGSLLGAAALLTITGLAAAWLPARRAARVDPTITLRAH